jgi:hypothetical protein
MLGREAMRESTRRPTHDLQTEVLPDDEGGLTIIRPARRLSPSEAALHASRRIWETVKAKAQKKRQTEDA